MGISEQSRGSVKDWRRIDGVGEPTSVPRGLVETSHRALGYAVQRQLQAQKDGEFEGFSKAPLRYFAGHPLYTEIFADAKSVLLSNENITGIPDGEFSEEEFRESLRARIVEALGYGILSSRQRSGEKAVISPDETLQFYKSLNPRYGYKRIYLQTTLDGISVPDGITIDPKAGKVKDILDYTINLAGKSRSQIDIEIGNIGRMNNKYFEGTKFKLVAPLQKRSQETNGKLKGITITDLPFSVQDVFDLESKMYGELLDNLGFVATPEDIAAQIHRQEVALRMLVKAHQSNRGYVLDPTWAEYGVKRQMQGAEVQLPEGIEVLLRG